MEADGVTWCRTTPVPFTLSRLLPPCSPLLFEEYEDETLAADLRASRKAERECQNVVKSTQPTLWDDGERESQRREE